MKAQKKFSGLLALSASMLTASAAHAASLTVQVLDQSGTPLADSVVYAEAASGQSPPKVLQPAAIEQKNRMFIPLVTAIQIGTSVSFPNNDTVRHHVYSFSPGKTFELKLYSGVPGNPVVFDKAGTIVIGCNIHDKMISYIHVVDTPYFAKTNAAGKVTLEGIVAGKYTLKAWHFGMPTTEAIPEQAIVLSSDHASASFKLKTTTRP